MSILSGFMTDTSTQEITQEQPKPARQLTLGPSVTSIIWHKHQSDGEGQLSSRAMLIAQT